jgi:hypothetical protein
MRHIIEQRGCYLFTSFHLEILINIKYNAYSEISVLFLKFL